MQQQNNDAQYMMLRRFCKELKWSGLSPQQKRTLRGQAFAGDLEGARKGLEKLMRRQNTQYKEAK